MGPEIGRNQPNTSSECRLPGLRGTFCSMLKQQNPAACFLLEAVELEIANPNSSMQAFKAGVIKAMECPRLGEVLKIVNSEIEKRKEIPTT